MTATTFVIVALAALVNILLYLPVIIRTRSLRRDLCLEKAKLELCVVATEMQKYMADSTLKHGGVIHDVFYEVVNQAQHMDRFLNVVPFATSRRRQARALGRNIRDELAQAPEQIKHLATRFMMAYLHAAVFRHPIHITLLVLFFYIRNLHDALRDKLVRLILDITNVKSTEFLTAPALHRLAICAVATGVTFHAPRDCQNRSVRLTASTHLAQA